MINKLLSHESSPWFCAGAIGLGTTLLLIGSLAISHPSPVGACFCAAGGVTTAGALFFTAMKIDHYFKCKRMEESCKNAQASYIPQNNWRQIFNKNVLSTVPILDPDIPNDDPAVIRNTNFDDDFNRLLNGESEHHHDQL